LFVEGTDREKPQCHYKSCGAESACLVWKVELTTYFDVLNPNLRGHPDARYIIENAISSQVETKKKKRKIASRIPVIPIDSLAHGFCCWLARWRRITTAF
jgi:hypothetical protein